MVLLPARGELQDETTAASADSASITYDKGSDVRKADHERSARAKVLPVQSAAKLAGATARMDPATGMDP
jgi:hypothetical protein